MRLSHLTPPIPFPSAFSVPKSKPSFACSACGATALRWTGKCVKCGEFGTVAEVAPVAPTPGRRASTSGTAPLTPARSVSAVTATGPVARISTGVGEFDRVLGSRRASGNYSSLSSKATSRRGSSERNSFMSLESSKSTYSTSSLKSFGDVPDGDEAGGVFQPRHSTGLASIFNVDGGQTPSPPGSGKSNPTNSPPQNAGPAKKRNLSLWQRVTHSP